MQIWGESPIERCVAYVSSILENCFDVLRFGFAGPAQLGGPTHCRGIIRINSMQQAKITNLLSPQVAYSAPGLCKAGWIKYTGMTVLESYPVRWPWQTQGSHYPYVTWNLPRCAHAPSHTAGAAAPFTARKVWRSPPKPSNSEAVLDVPDFREFARPHCHDAFAVCFEYDTPIFVLLL
jgi:hypothetical protein